jgi:hypothetical protein
MTATRGKDDNDQGGIPQFSEERQECRQAPILANCQVGDEGLETSSKTSGQTANPTTRGTESGTLETDCPILDELVAIWPTLGQGDRDAVLAFTRQRSAPAERN